MTGFLFLGRMILIKIFVALSVWAIFSPYTYAQNTAPIYRCGNSYSQNPCTGGRQVDTRPLIENHDAPQRTKPTRRHFSQPNYWEQEQVRQAAQKARIRQRQERQARQQQQRRCAELAQQIEQLDAQGRIGGTSAYMDRLRERRRLVREEQVRQNCI